MNSLYQESFTGKGSLCLELIPPVEVPVSRLEGWELNLKNGRLSLKGASPFSTVQALSFLSTVAPGEIERQLGKKQLTKFLRCLRIKNKFDLTDAIAQKLVKLGFNSVILNHEQENVLVCQEYGLKVLNFFEPDLTKHYSRKWLLKDYLLSLLNSAPSDTLFFIKNEECFEELHFDSSASISFVFPASNSHFQKLREPEFYPSSFMPLILTNDHNKVRQALEECRQSPCNGHVLEVENVPESTEEQSVLWAANFSVMSAISFDRLLEMWAKSTERQSFEK